MYFSVIWKKKHSTLYVVTEKIYQDTLLSALQTAESMQYVTC